MRACARVCKHVVVHVCVCVCARVCMPVGVCKVHRGVLEKLQGMGPIEQSTWPLPRSLGSAPLSSTELCPAAL